MDTRTVEQIEDWDSRPFSGGYAGLHELADAQFSGAVSAGRAWLFMLNGRVVGVFEGTIEDFEGHDGTVHEAPDPSLPLLFSMLELGGETQANYYTNDTPLSEANGTLADAAFTGYVELSENVLSGDYYTVYYGGRSMSAAFVGASERLLTGDEAFDRADDEVGIYEVVDVDLELIDIPEVEEPDPEPEPTAAVVDEPDESDEPEASEPGEPTTTKPASDPEPAASEPETDDVGVAPDPLGSSAPEPGETGEPTEPEPASTGSADRAEAGAAESTPAEPGTRPEEPAERPAETEPERRPPSAGTPEPDPATREANRPEEDDRNAGRPDEREGATPPTASDAPRSDDDVFSEEEQWRETKSIPSLDPDRSEAGESVGAGARAGGRSAGSGAARSRSGSAGRGQSRGQRAAQERRQQPEKPTPQQSPRERAEATAGRPDRAKELEASLRKHKQEIERLRSEVSDLQSEREDFEEERAEFEEERSELEGEIERLKGELEEARADAAASAGAAGAAVSGGQEPSPDEALDGTNLFVRYGSKGKPTLETAHSGRADKGEVNDNLKLEHHTQFDADDVTVDGRPFDEFLRTTIEYNFVRWAVCELLYEIRDTGHKGGMREVYDALPRVDRAELGGTVSVVTTADGEERERIEEFDVILRDRMGNPLLVANLNDARDPATGDVMSSLVDSASAVCESHEELGGAFYVTASFFEPAALETASEATSGGLLSREKRDSYVKFARKRGYHLCLVETRAGEFHVNVPEL